MAMTMRKVLGAEVPDGRLERVVTTLAPGARRLAVKELARVVSSLLDMELTPLFVEAWGGVERLREAARQTMAIPGSHVQVQLHQHAFEWTHRPRYQVLVDEIPAIEIGFDLTLKAEVLDLWAAVTDGKLVEIHSGDCRLSATLSVDDVEVLTGASMVDLAAVVRLGSGLPLLPEAGASVERGAA
jgi:hypothetical protein